MKFTPISRLTFTGAVAVIAVLSAMPGASAHDAVNPGAIMPNPNMIGNPGFESAINSGTCCPQSVGNWFSYIGTGAAPAREGTVIRSGTQALEVTTLGGYGTGGGAYQEFPNFPAGTSYKLSSWALPSAGQQDIELILGLDRAGGTSLGQSRISIYPDHLVASAWGQSRTFPTATNQYFGGWHNFMLKVNANTLKSKLYVDGTLIGTTPAGTTIAAATATLYVGMAAWTGPASHYYFDDTSLKL